MAGGKLWTVGKLCGSWQAVTVGKLCGRGQAVWQLVGSVAVGKLCSRGQAMWRRQVVYRWQAVCRWRAVWWFWCAWAVFGVFWPECQNLPPQRPIAEMTASATSFSQFVDLK